MAEEKPACAECYRTRAKALRYAAKIAALLSARYEAELLSSAEKADAKAKESETRNDRD